MSIWDTEIVNVQGDLMCVVRVQNDFTGNITPHLRKIFMDSKGIRYVNIDTMKVDVEEALHLYKRHNDMVEVALNYYHETHKER